MAVQAVQQCGDAVGAISREIRAITRSCVNHVPRRSLQAKGLAKRCAKAETLSARKLLVDST